MRDSIKRMVRDMSEKDINDLHRLVSEKRDRYAYMRAEGIAERLTEGEIEKILEIEAEESIFRAMRHLEKSNPEINVPTARYVINILRAKAS